MFKSDPIDRSILLRSLSRAGEKFIGFLAPERKKKQSLKNTWFFFP